MQRPTWARHVLATGILLMAAMGFAPPSQASPGPFDEGLPNVDLRAAERAPVPAETRAARVELADDLGPLGEVGVDRKSGGVSYVGRSDGLLTGAVAEARRSTIALDYVRAHDDVFGLAERDIANLEARRARRQPGRHHPPALQPGARRDRVLRQRARRARDGATAA